MAAYKIRLKAGANLAAAFKAGTRNEEWYYIDAAGVEQTYGGYTDNTFVDIPDDASIIQVFEDDTATEPAWEEAEILAYNAAESEWETIYNYDWEGSLMSDIDYVEEFTEDPPSTGEGPAYETQFEYDDTSGSTQSVGING